MYKKTVRPTLSKVYSQVLQNVTERVDLAFKAFFRRLKSGEEPGYPRFKGYGRYDSMTYAQTGFKVDGEWLDLSKVGRIWMVLHRPIEGKIKTLTIRQSSIGKWYVCFSCEVETEALPPTDKIAWQKVLRMLLGINWYSSLLVKRKRLAEQYYLLTHEIHPKCVRDVVYWWKRNCLTECIIVYAGYPSIAI